jgi:hypothetical protein
MTLSPETKDIIASKPRIWEHLLFSQAFADMIAETGICVATNAAPTAAFMVDTHSKESLMAFTYWAKARALELSGMLTEFNSRLVEQLRAAAGPKGTPGSVDALLEVAANLADVYRNLIAHTHSLNQCTWAFSADFPPLPQEAFEASFISILNYLKEESRRLRTHFERYGPEAVAILHEASAKLERGEDPGRIDVYNISFSFRPFDESSVDFLVSLIDHVVSTRTETGTSGFIYLLTNPSMPGLVKIGHTTRASVDRITELSRATGVPTAFVLVFDQFVSDSVQVERRVHAALANYRVASNREFFSVSTNIAIKTILAAAN